MALARAMSIALVGVVGHLVEVEADLALGLPGLVIVGLPDTALSEARDRVRAAVVNSGQAWPSRRITLGLSPATLPKQGSGFDLAIAVTILAAAGVVPAAALDERAFVGELGLDGRVRPCAGCCRRRWPPAAPGCAGSWCRPTTCGRRRWCPA